ncbi:DUF4373 domain-containing protein [Desulfosporosinus youngiae]|uniref:Lin1244/Lin1753-like N-terminal domain-containing protein n=1 Tax=Desulfosporosinus youngiae DSM 17734 TaxID=768710 RepID=H5XZX0_9FIRM|nr:DUF4373 domain-containing protein [Desulfosporosinus youngiae]EHQ92166.1 hypothetical protein DesyoDRAFT_5236 [Desulfosporosinus youngiae DSM 17734]
MARPQKEGLDYFSLDVDMDQDDKVLLIEAKHKITGFAILLKLLMKVYKEGYFYKWSEREQLLFSSRVNVDIDIVTDVVNDCLKWDLFNSLLYEKYQILTSGGIQRRYIEAVKRRKEVTLIREYLVIDPPLDKDDFKIHLINVNKNPLNADINPADSEIKDTEIPKVKESKVKENKANNSFARFWDAYPKKKSKGQAEKAFTKLKVDEQFMGVILAAIKRAKKSADWQKENGRFIPYPSTWLNAKGWEDEQPKDPGDKPPEPPKPGKYDNFYL